MKHPKLLSAVLLLLMFLLAACGAGSPAGAPDDQPVLSPVPTGEVPPPPIEESPVAEPDGGETVPPVEDGETGETGPRGLPEMDDQLATAVEQIMTQLAAQTGLSMDEMTLVSAEAVEWPNSALGCPEAGMMYTEVIIPGYHVIIEGNGESFDIGTDQEVSRLAICPKDSTS